MSQFYRYKSAPGVSPTFAVDLGVDAVRLASIDGLVEMAQHCQVGHSTIEIDDPDADVGNSGDAILGHQRFEIDEGDMAVGNRRLWMGYTAEREYVHDDSLIIEDARRIMVHLVDLNALLSFRVIPQSDTAANRPAETVSARLTWILASTYLSGIVADNGLVVYATDNLDAVDYRGQRPVNVIGDCELAAGYNAFVYPDETKSVIASLFFDDANTSTAFTSTLSISNLLSDQTATCLPPSKQARLRRSPEDVGSGVYLPYAKGAVYRTRAGTVTTYGSRDLSAPNANVKSSTKANALADKFLWEHRLEEDRISVSVDLSTSQVNLIRAGHRIQVKFRHLPGYEGFVWCRVTQRSVGAFLPTDQVYTVALELVPQEAPCVESVLPTFVQYDYEDGNTNHAPNYSQDYDLDAPSTIGNLLLLAVMCPIVPDVSVMEAPSGWTWAVQNAATALQRCNLFWKVSQGDQEVTVRYSAADGQRRVQFIEYAGLNNPTVYDMATLHQPTSGGYTIIPATDYPAGPTAVIAVAFMDDGPGAPDNLSVTGTGLTLRTPITAGLHGSTEVAIGDMLRDSTSGTTPEYPAGGGWRFLFTGSEDQDVYGVGISFQGNTCP